MVNGILYTTAGTRRAVVALNGTTGELLWMHAEREGARAAASPRQLSGRGVAYWTRWRATINGSSMSPPDFGSSRSMRKPGSASPSFGKDGIVDLKDGVVFGIDQPIDPETGEIGLHATPAITRDGVVMIGVVVPRRRHTEDAQQHQRIRSRLRRQAPVSGSGRSTRFRGRASSATDTWEKDSWAINGNVGVWNQIAVDEDLGLAYLPVETPSSDFYGGLRPGNNLFAESVVAVDYQTGKRKWHFQLVHHPIWNMDIAAAPILIDITVDGRPIKAVAVMGKQAMLYVFDRVNGEPVLPIDERPVPQSDVPGEKTSPTQPFPTKPPPYDHQGVTIDNVIDFTPELNAEAIEDRRSATSLVRSSRRHRSAAARDRLPGSGRRAARTGRAVRSIRKRTSPTFRRSRRCQCSA